MGATTKKSQHTYLTLDGIRGVAAVLIVIRHSRYFFGDFQPSESFLAVDLFFALSGFVLAHAYTERLNGSMTAGEFMKARAIRLFPLYALGLFLGVLVALASIHSGFGLIPPEAVPWAVALGAVGLPTPPIGGTDDIYPLNPVHWSLFFEMVANLVMVLFWRRLTLRAIGALCAISAAGLFIAVPYLGGADAGFEWNTFAVGFARVGFSFFAGIGIYRLKDRFTYRIPAAAALLLTAVLLGVSPPEAARSWYELACILLIFPWLILGASNAEPMRGAALFRFLGVTSYAIYALHHPAQRLVNGAFLKLGINVTDYAPWGGVSLVSALLLGCWAVDRVYDAPARRWLTARFQRQLATTEPKTA